MKYNGCLAIPSLAVNIDLASIPELRVLTREGVASCKWTVKLGLRLLILVLDTIFLQYCMMLYHFSEKDTPRLCPPCPCTAWDALGTVEDVAWLRGTGRGCVNFSCGLMKAFQEVLADLKILLHNLVYHQRTTPPQGPRWFHCNCDQKPENQNEDTFLQ